METLEAIGQRRSVRKYKNTPVSRRDLIGILEAGIKAPSAHNLQPWYFVAIQSTEQLRKLAAVMDRVAKAVEPGLAERFRKHPSVVKETTHFIQTMGGAPVCILAFELRPAYPDHVEESITESVSAALENMVLAAADRGLGTCWMTAPLEAGAADELRELFAPGKGRMVAMLTLGYPEGPSRPIPRKDGRYTIV